MFKHLEENNIEFFPSETHFFLLKLKKDKEHVETELEKRKSTTTADGSVAVITTSSIVHSFIILVDPPKYNATFTHARHPSKPFNTVKKT
jgi:hypothetical protein